MYNTLDSQIDRQEQLAELRQQVTEKPFNRAAFDQYVVTARKVAGVYRSVHEQLLAERGASRFCIKDLVSEEEYATMQEVELPAVSEIGYAPHSGLSVSNGQRVKCRQPLKNIISFIGEAVLSGPVVNKLCYGAVGIVGAYYSVQDGVFASLAGIIFGGVGLLLCASTTQTNPHLRYAEGIERVIANLEQRVECLGQE